MSKQKIKQQQLKYKKKTRPANIDTSKIEKNKTCRYQSQIIPKTTRGMCGLICGSGESPRLYLARAPQLNTTVVHLW